MNHRSVVSWALLPLIGLACRTPSDTYDSGGGRRLTPLWHATVATPRGLFNSPLVTQSGVIVGGARHLYGLDLSTRRMKWEMPLAYLTPFSGLVVTRDSTVALVSGDGFVVFDPITGQTRRSWSATTFRNDVRDQTTPQMLSEGRIAFADGERHLLLLDPRTGRVDTLARLPGTDERRSYVVSLAVLRDTIYAPVASYALRGARYRNTMPYRYALGTRQLGSLRPDPSDSASLSSWLLQFDDLLVSATNYTEPSWLGFDRATAERRWKVGAAPASLGPSGQVGVVRDTLFGAANDGRAYVMHIPTGRLIRSMQIPNGLATAEVACGSDFIIDLVDGPLWRSRDGHVGGSVSGLKEGADSFVGDFGVGHGIAVIRDGGSGWMALPCPPPQSQQR